MVDKGLEDPSWCKKIRWDRASKPTSSGRMKCKEKKRFKVGWETEKFPQSHCMMSLPTYGIADSILVITVAPQKDICPQGRTYPINAAPIVASRIPTPEIHTIGSFSGELKKMPRPTWQ